MSGCKPFAWQKSLISARRGTSMVDFASDTPSILFTFSTVVGLIRAMSTRILLVAKTAGGISFSLATFCLAVSSLPYRAVSSSFSRHETADSGGFKGEDFTCKCSGTLLSVLLLLEGLLPFPSHENISNRDSCLTGEPLVSRERCVESAGKALPLLGGFCRLRSSLDCNRRLGFESDPAFNSQFLPCNK